METNRAEATVSEFHVTDVFWMSSIGKRFIVGRMVGVFEIGQSVTLRQQDGTTVSGTLEAINLHRQKPGFCTLVFSEEISNRVQPGDLIHD